MRRKSGNGTASPQWIYLMVCFPTVFLWKVGISGKVGRRARQVSDKVFGIAVPVFAVWVPYAWHLEQFMHGIFYMANVRYGKGREWFLFPVAPFAFLIMLTAMAFWLAVAMFICLVAAWFLGGCPPEPVERLFRLFHL